MGGGDAAGVGGLEEGADLAFGLVETGRVRLLEIDPRRRFDATNDGFWFITYFGSLVAGIGGARIVVVAFCIGAVGALLRFAFAVTLVHILVFDATGGVIT